MPFGRVPRVDHHRALRAKWFKLPASKFNSVFQRFKLKAWPLKTGMSAEIPCEKAKGHTEMNRVWMRGRKQRQWQWVIPPNRWTEDMVDICTSMSLIRISYNETLKRLLAQTSECSYFIGNYRKVTQFGYVSSIVSLLLEQKHDLAQQRAVVYLVSDAHAMIKKIIWRWFSGPENRTNPWIFIANGL